MTLIVALKGRITRDSNIQGIVVASDTQVTSYIKQPMQKVFQLSSLPILIGGAGLVSLSRHTIFCLKKVFSGFRKELRKKTACEDFDVVVNSNIKSVLREIVKSHSDIIEQSSFSLVLGFSDATDVRLYEVQNDGVPMRMDDNPGYCCIGSGCSTGGSLLIQQFYSGDLTLYQLTVLASYIISQVNSIDPNVGSMTKIRFGFGGKVIKPKEKIVQERLELRSETMKKVWNLLESGDLEFERRFNKAFEKDKIRKVIKII